MLREGTKGDAVTHRGRIRSVTALLGAAAVVVIAGVLPAAAYPAAASTPVAAQPDRLITLVTGERILERSGSGGGLSYSAVAPADRTPLLRFETNGASYVIPAVAMHSVGAPLDASLFNTAALQQAESASPGQVPVRVQWHGATAPVMSWLVHPVTVAAGVTDGVVTSSSGAALQSAVAAGTLTGIDRISLVGAAPSPRPTPAGFTLYTLTVNGINAAGAPDTGDAAIFMNTDDARKTAGAGFAFWYHGVFKVSVPNGHYSLLGDFVSFAAPGAVSGGGPPPSGEERMAILNFTVHGNTTVTVDARTATARIAVTTPLPTDVGSGGATWQRSSQLPTGVTAFATIWPIGGGAPVFKVYVSPGPAPSIGTQGWLTSFHLDSPSTSTSAYSYDLTFGGLGAISATQGHVVTLSQLATVATRYFSSVAGNPALELRQSFFAWQFISFGQFDNFNAPLDRTEYVLASPDLLWMQQVVADANTFEGVSFELESCFRAG